MSFVNQKLCRGSIAVKCLLDRKWYMRILILIISLAIATAVVFWINPRPFIDALDYCAMFATGSYRKVAVFHDYTMDFGDRKYFTFYSKKQVYKTTLRLRFVDGATYGVATIQEDAVAKICGNRFDDNSENIERHAYSSQYGYETFIFIEGRLDSFHLGNNSEIGIDFGDGEFRSLPIPRDELHRSIGFPVSIKYERDGRP